MHTKYNLQYRYGIEINCNFPRYSYIQISMVMPCKFPHHRSILHVLSRHTAEGVRLLNSIFHRKMLEYTTQSHAVLRKISIGLMFTSEIITLHQCKHSGNTCHLIRLMDLGTYIVNTAVHNAYYPHHEMNHTTFWGEK